MEVGKAANNNNTEGTFFDIFHNYPLSTLVLIIGVIFILVGALQEVEIPPIKAKGRSPFLMGLGILLFIAGILIHPDVDAIGIWKKRESDRIQAMQNSALGSLDARNYDRAIQSLSNLIEAQPSNVSALNMLTRAYFLRSFKGRRELSNQDYQTAFYVNRRAYEIDPSNLDAWMLRAWGYWRRASLIEGNNDERQKYLAEAVRSIDLALSKNKNWEIFTRATSLCMKSQILQRQNRQEEANQARRDALADNPNVKCD